jgi:polysaccharide export outer membrane protein
MRQISRNNLVVVVWAVVAACSACTGCLHHDAIVPPGSNMAVELNKVSLPEYVIEPPDILLIEAVRAVPVPPYKLEPLDQLNISVPGAAQAFPINGVYGIDPDGTVNLGITYGKIPVVGMTIDQAKAAIENHLGKPPAGLQNPQANVSLAQSQQMQQISGEHLVRMDGTISLGTYGKVYVTGLTVDQAKEAVQEHLAKFLLKPLISMDILAYNSKVFYVITDTAGFGIQIARLPITGNETVLDALSQINGLPPGTSRKRIWVARPAPPGSTCGDQILPVDWCGITEEGQTATNYQLFPGDRLYVKPDPWVGFDNAVAKVLTPFERIFGFGLLGNATVRALAGQTGTAGGNGTGLGTGTGAVGF